MAYDQAELDKTLAARPQAEQDAIRAVAVADTRDKGVNVGPYSGNVLSPGAASALSIPDLGGQWQTAMGQKQAAVKKVTDAMQAKQAELGPIEQRIMQENRNAPAAPKLEKVPEKFEFPPMKNEDITAQMGMLFAFSAIAGALTRQPMTTALQAFSGGMKGMVEGDNLAFKRGMETFDRNMKAAIAKNAEAVNEYKVAMDKHAGDLNGMMTEWKLIAAKHQDTVMAAQIERQDADTMMKHIENAARMGDQAERTRLQIEQRNTQFQQTIDSRMALQDQRIAAEAERARLDRESRERINQERNAIKEKAAAQGGKPTATERQHYMDSNRLVKDVDRVREMLSNPVIKQKVDAERLGGVLSDTVESKLLQQYLVRPNLDPDVKNYLTAISLLRNQYYLDQSGKAVTGGEALRNYGAVVQPGDTSDDVLNKMEIMRTRAGERMRDYETYFPSLSAINRQPGAAGGEQLKSYNSVEEATAAGATPGTRVIINGVTGTLQ